MELPWMRQCLLLFCVIILVQASGTKGCFQEEKTALLRFKEFVILYIDSGDPPLPSWINDSKSDCCSWERVTCDPSSGHVIHLSLEAVYQWNSMTCFMVGFNFSVFLPLKELKSLNLSSNCIVPIEIQDCRYVSPTLKKLEILDLSCNGFLPPEHVFNVQELSTFRNLELLDLSYNKFTSPTTEDLNALSTLKKLRNLNLAGNHFDVDIFKYLVALPALRSLYLQDQDFLWPEIDPAKSLDDKVLAKLSKLEILTLRSSKLIGPLPNQGLCKLKNLQEVDLSQNKLTGTLHRCLENLTSLRALDLSHNMLNGTIPSSLITPLVSLEYLSISFNNFEGLFFLSSLANNSKLKVLTLGGMYNKKFEVETENPAWVPSFQLEFLHMSNSQVNLATRTLPTFLSSQNALKVVDLSYNNLVGLFPIWLLRNNPQLESVILNHNAFNGSFQLPSDRRERMDSLLQLKISHNMIQGKLSKNIGFFLPKLEYLNLSNNNLDGDIPASIGEMSNLKILDLAYNNLSGKVPKQVFLGCISLNVLRLSSNRLEGQIFPKPLNLRSLRILIMDNNLFNGTLQDGLLDMKKLQGMDLSGNNLAGKLPAWIGKFSSLSYLSLSRNKFKGAIPDNLCLLDLKLMKLSYNRFSTVPACNFQSLNFLHLQGNNLNGTLPESLLSSLHLVTVDLRDNKYVGVIPDSIRWPTHLRFLLLGGNELQGELTDVICQLEELNFLDLSRNNFTGSIPSCLSHISFGIKGPVRFINTIVQNEIDIDIGAFLLESTSFYIKYEFPHFDLGLLNEDPSYSQEEVEFTTKSVPLSYKGNILYYMSGIDLSSNKLTGEIPKQIGDLHALHALNLSHNHLNGTIPKNFFNLEDIESLDLSYNNLSGRIPNELQDLKFVAFFNVSYNNLSGRAPNQGQFGSFDESSYIGNPHLSVDNSNRGIAPPATLQRPPTSFNDGEEDESAIDVIAFYWTFGASYVTILLMFVTILWINPYWRRRWFYFIETRLYQCLGRFLPYAFY